MKMEVYMEGLNEMTEEMQEEVVHLENVLVENERIFNEQWKIDWREIQDRLEQERRYEIKMGEKL